MTSAHNDALADQAVLRAYRRREHARAQMWERDDVLTWLSDLLNEVENPSAHAVLTQAIAAIQRGDHRV